MISSIEGVGKGKNAMLDTLMTDHQENKTKDQHSSIADWIPDRDTALEIASRVDPAAYAKTRNHLSGAVTHLSPWITHGFITLPEVVEVINKLHPMTAEDKLMMELGWREFFAHVHQHLGSGIFKDVRRPVYSGRYQYTLPTDIQEGRTGVPIIDEQVKVLYSTGYLHNHARLWIASYIVHLRKVHWKTGADWMYSHLLDGDLASNSLSWQWVAGTFSNKPYLFNAENVRQFSGVDCTGTVIDTDYATLGALAIEEMDVGPEIFAPVMGLEVPETWSAREAIETLSRALNQSNQVNQNFVVRDLTKSTDMNETAEKMRLAGSMQLITPWDMKALWSDGDAPKVALIDIGFHEQFRWSARRWEFVLSAMFKRADKIWLVDSRKPAPIHQTKFLLQQPNVMIKASRCEQPGYKETLQYLGAQLQEPNNLFSEPGKLMGSFSKFYRQVTQMQRKWHSQ